MRKHLLLVLALAGCGQMQAFPIAIPGFPSGSYPGPTVLPNLPEGTPDFIQVPGDDSPPVQFLPSPTKGTPQPGSSPAPVVTNPPEAGQLTAAEQVILAKTNQARQDAGAGPLKIDMAITGVARARSKDMGDRNYFSHTSPTGETAVSMMKDAGISFSASGENIGKGMGTPDSSAPQIFDAWMKSDGHRANIVNARYARIGIGVIAAGNTIYFTQVFAN